MKIYQVTQNEKHYIIKILFFKIKIRKQNNNYIYLYKLDGSKKKIKCNSIKGLNIKFKGSNNSCLIYEPLQKFNNCKITLENNCKLTIKGQSSQKFMKGINGLKIIANKSNNNITIGKDLYIGHGSSISLTQGATFEIGDGCMISEFLKVFGGDGHIIMNSITNEPIVKSANIKIGNHVWIGQNVTLLKNAQIGNNSIVGTQALVTKSFTKENVVIAGNPAKIVKENINWAQ